MSAESFSKLRETLRLPERRDGAPMSEEEIVKVAKIALAWAEDFWEEEMLKVNKQPSKPRLILYHGKTEEERRGFLGEPQQPITIKSSMGPVFSQRAHAIYLDPQSLEQVLAKPNGSHVTPLIVAIVVLHEFSHWVQEFFDIRHRFQTTASHEPSRAAELHDVYETQADFLAGAVLHAVHQKKDILEEGDIEEALAFIKNPVNFGLFARLSESMCRTFGADLVPHSNAEHRVEHLREGMLTGDWVEELLAHDDLLDSDSRMRLMRLTRSKEQIV